jgi:hypothetical protein
MKLQKILFFPREKFNIFGMIHLVLLVLCCITGFLYIRPVKAGLEASQSRLQMLTSHKNNLEFQIMLICQRRIDIESLLLDLETSRSYEGTLIHGKTGLPFYQNSYAVVIGIDKYSFKPLKNAVNDAISIEKYLTEQGFQVISLYNEKATGKKITEAFYEHLCHGVGTEDRTLFYFSGHGDTEHIGKKDYGYIIPYDAKRDDFQTYISMDKIKLISEKLVKAKQQLFILDSCYGGLLGKDYKDYDKTPNYAEVTARKGRFFLSSGGSKQRVTDYGLNGHSFFANALLNGLKTGLADNNCDGYITFSELASYIVNNASNEIQSPGWINTGEPGAEYVFRVPKTAIQQKYREHIQKYDNYQPGKGVDENKELSMNEYTNQIKQNEEKINQLIDQITQIDDKDKTQSDMVLQSKRKKLQEELDATYSDNIDLNRKLENSRLFNSNLRTIFSTMDIFKQVDKNQIDYLKLQDKQLEQRLENLYAQRELVDAELKSIKKGIDKNTEPK